MFNQYFGNYLLEKSLIKPEELTAVLEAQKSVKVKLGVLAIDSGYMTAEQVSQVHKLQAVKDRKFGALAVEEGYLTEEQLDELLHMQRKSNILIGQVLIEKGFFTYEKYEEVLRHYRKDSKLTDDEILALKNSDINKIVEIFIKSLPIEQIGMLSEYFELFVKNIIRFIDDEIRVEAASEADSYQFDNLITQRMGGEYGFFSGFASSEPVLAHFASVYAQEELSTMNEMAADSLGEFLNCQNGLFLSNLSHEGTEWELYLPEVQKGGVLKPVSKLYVIPCHLSFGKIDFLFAEGRPSYSN
ncbi:MAG TPA: hypothetical protein VN381_09635 [Anaerovoracaceae bacterium]|nr:hypothetical protein [Anaerovoracaceae bacterium]